LTCTSEQSRRSGAQTRSPRATSGSSAPDQSRAGQCASSKAQAPCAPNSDRERHRSGGPNGQLAPPCRDQTRIGTGPDYHPADPSCVRSPDLRLKPTESRLASRLNESFATQSVISGHRGVFWPCPLYPPESGHPCASSACPLCANRRHSSPPHSITSSARSRNDSGMIRPIALAALRLITSSNLLAC